MNTVKSLLLIITSIYSLLYIGAVDSLSNFNLLIGFIIGAALVFLCKKVIKREDIICK